jgi:hypothetical protein
MITRFISDRIYESLDLEYPFDSDIKIQSTKIGVDGNLDYTEVKPLSNIKDLKINNYTLNILTDNKKTTNLLESVKTQDEKNIICNICYEKYFGEPIKVANSTPFWYGIAYGKDRFVATSRNTNNGISNGIYSFDGINWFDMQLTKRKFWDSVTYGVDKFVTLASFSFPVSDENIGAYSFDGINWSEMELPLKIAWRDVKYLDDKFVAVGDSLSGAYSFNGINWFEMKMPDIGPWYSVAYGNGVYVSTVLGSASGAYSTDGITWSAMKMPFNGAWNSVAFGKDKFVAIAQNTVNAAYSFDGINWQSSSIGVNRTWRNITYGDDKFVACSLGSGNTAAYSSDGIFWTTLTLTNFLNNPSIAYNWQKVAYGNGEFIFLASNNHNAQPGTASFFNRLAIEEVYWKAENDFISLTSVKNNLTDKNFFEINFLDNDNCQISHEIDNIKHYLTYSYTTKDPNKNSNFIRITPVTADNFDFYNKDFNYIKQENGNIIFYKNCPCGNYAIFNNKESGLSNQRNKLSFIKSNEFIDNNFFKYKSIKKYENELITNDWVSYDNSFHRNNLNVRNDKSYLNIKNNFLFSTTINSIVSSIPVNILTLKNQLNQENEQSRGNPFLNEEEINIKEYESIFTGGWNEKGFDKIHLGYSIYTTPFKFKSDKISYFHVPHDIYPYVILNINNTKLAEAGAVAGSSPINSDKIWKKLKDYRDTSPYSIPQEENTGQWLCTWLSAGNPDTRPIWVDRYYNPSKITPYVALSAIATEIIYNNSFDCFDLKEDISDVKSSLTFEKGAYYAYMHLGKKDFQNLIKTIDDKILYKSLQRYKTTRDVELNAIDNIYRFDGAEYGYIDSSKNFDHNVANFSFFANKENWTIPTGNLIFGNYVNNGFGFFNYNLNNPYLLLKKDKNELQVFNNNFDKINVISTENITLCGIKGISRREGFENIHVITNDFKLIEFDLRGTIVDSNSAIGNVLNLKITDKIYSITNDENYCYVHTSSGVAAIDLFSNIVIQKNIKTNIDVSGEDFYIIADKYKNVYVVNGYEPILRENNIFYHKNNEIKNYNVTLSALSSYMQFDDGFIGFNIDKNNHVYVLSGYDLLIYKDKILKNKIHLEILENVNILPISINFSEKFENSKLIEKTLIYAEDINQSFVLEIDSDGEKKLIDVENFTPIQSNLDITNYNYNHSYLRNLYNEKTYNFKARLLNKVDLEDYDEINFIIKGDDLSTGIRYFSFNIDTFNGIATCYVDGILYDTQYFEKKKYIFTNTFNGRIFYGANGFFNGTPAYVYFKDNSDYLYGGIDIFKNNIINKNLDQSEVLYFYREQYPPEDLIYNMPSGTRSFIDKIETFFNFNIPMFKSNYFDLNILNSGILYDDIKVDMEKYIESRIQEFLPFYTKINKFKWLDIKSGPIVIEGDYNVSNTLTDL